MNRGRAPQERKAELGKVIFLDLPMPTPQKKKSLLSSVWLPCFISSERHLIFASVWCLSRAPEKTPLEQTEERKQRCLGEGIYKASSGLIWDMTGWKRCLQEKACFLSCTFWFFWHSRGWFLRSSCLESNAFLRQSVREEHIQPRGASWLQRSLHESLFFFFLQLEH